jgi:N-acetyl-1-D-myo-inositol-2-amino-2-deoxy-alpha-D-glucopyranoside deacetylase
MPAEQLRLMAVHAHADDESITMGGTMAVLATRGVALCNVCCTDGELATIVAKDMPEETTRPHLGEIRRAELRAACRLLGVERVEFLGFHDSGMAGTETARRPEAFAMQPVSEAAEQLCRIIRDFRPHVVVTYDGYGAYGHPDHIQAHRITLVAVEAAHMRGVFPDAGAPWRVSKLYYTVMPRSVLQRAVDMALAAGMDHPFDGRDVDELEFAADDDAVTAVVDVRDGMSAKRAALRAHHSQIDETFPMLSVPEEVLRELFGDEHYQLALTRVPVTIPESDLFAGIDGGAARGAGAISGAVALARS